MKNISSLLIGLCAIPLLISCTSQEEKTEQKRPNIVFIMSDDHAYQAISAYDNTLIETPNIDRIADMGMLFTNASVTNSICAPSRATILTGKHSHINGKVDNHFPFDTTNVTFPQILQDAGYQTAMFGKLHFGNSPKGFDQYKILPGQGKYYNPNFITKNEGNIQVEGYVTDIITDMTLDWLENERNDEDPFMLMYLHKAPHREWLPAGRHVEEFTNRTFKEPATLFDDYSGRGRAAKEAEMNLLKDMHWAGDSKIRPEVMDELGIEPTSGWDKAAFEGEVGRMNPEQRAVWDKAYEKVIEDFKKAYPNMTEEDKMKWRYQRYMQDYLGTIKAVDENVGRVLDYLEANDLMDNTIIVYTSDQGFYLGEHGWFDKRFIYNESFKTPLLMAWPGKVQAGTKSDEMVQNLDFAQTFLAAAGIEAPADMQGESLLPLLTGDLDNWTRDAVYYHYYEYPSVHMVKRHYAIVTQDYKLVHYYFDVDEWELIDRKNDPMELKNVYDDPAYAEIQAELHEQLDGLREKYGDNSQISQRYLNEYLDYLQENNSYAGGKNTELLDKIFKDRKLSTEN
ncbi:sulfatase family protein [Algoriphagus machipongonensis]|uniref:Mucin-desulfating sulfatase (N-acetylglucosamine-6-sulfatase) n=1 Tax=Algoriphagus machipongonensis TaxID=388413 RepID=A3HWF9_9BACT|nr:sulfatase [Algoriphagus machipongonensis]EAZ80932.1 mucin-desulfating sulfatase (N-acetylglucosamine-6-sulfatase) [Algoriphagus machipongonensis]